MTRAVPREVCRRLAGQMRKIRARLGLGIGDSFPSRRCVLREINRTNPRVEMKNDGLGGGNAMMMCRQVRGVLNLHVPRWRVTLDLTLDLYRKELTVLYHLTLSI